MFFIFPSMKRKRAYRVHCMSPMECRFQMLLGHTFMFGDIGLRRKKPLKTFKNKKSKN